MGFFKDNGNDWLEDETGVIDSVAIAKLIRENDLVKKEIKKVSEGDEIAMSKLQGRIERIEEVLEALSARVEARDKVSSEDNGLVKKIGLKIDYYKASIDNIDNQICTLYGKAHRKGEEVDIQEVKLLEQEIDRYREKIKLLEPLLEVLSEVE